MTPLETVGLIFIALLTSYIVTFRKSKRILTNANSVLVDVEGVWTRMPDEEFQEAVKNDCVFIGPDALLHLDRTKEREYYNSIMEELK